MFIERREENLHPESGLLLLTMMGIFSKFTILLLILLSCTSFTSTGWRVLFLLLSIFANIEYLPVSCFLFVLILDIIFLTSNISVTESNGLVCVNGYFLSLD
jgi:hypothetical protein